MKKIFILILILLPGVAFAESITLKSGKVIEGEVVEKTESHIRVDTSEKIWKIKRTDLSSESRALIDGLEVKGQARPLIREDETRKIPAVSSDNKLESFMSVVRGKFAAAQGKEALALLEDELAKCVDFDQSYCRGVFEGYLDVIGEFLGFYDEWGWYEEIDLYSRQFILKTSSIDHHDEILEALTSGDKTHYYYNFYARIHGMQALSLAVREDFAGAREYLSKIEKYDTSVAVSTRESIERLEKISSDDSMRRLFNEVYAMRLRLSVIADVPELLKPLYDKFDIKLSLDEDVNIRNLRSNVELIWKEIWGSDRQTFERRTLSLFMDFLDIETPSFLAWYYENIDGLSEEFKENMTGNFKCSFISLINYIILRARGFEVFYVSTWDKTRGWEAQPVFDKIRNFFDGKDEDQGRFGHILCMVKVSEKNFVFADFINNWISKPFSFPDLYEQRAEGYYEMKPGMDRKDLYSHFQLNTGVPITSYLTTNILLQIDRSDYQLRYGNRALETAWKRNPNNRNVYVILSEQNYKAGQYEEAIKNLYQCIKIYPNDLYAYLRLVDIYYEMGDYQKSIDSLNMASIIEPELGSDVDLPLAYAYIGLHDAPSALEHAKKYLKDNPDKPVIHSLLSGIYAIMGDNSAARKHSKKAIELYQREGDDKMVQKEEEVLQSLK
ncbi:MAG TPA: tetratricopeptide repeat protein [Candidatus Bathyarchaeia archaeon]|nr:tetratricopeptide repeat protein [Candidatus Bathyarchaeia archaeon]